METYHEIFDCELTKLEQFDQIRIDKSCVLWITRERERKKALNWNESLVRGLCFIATYYFIFDVAKGDVVDVLLEAVQVKLLENAVQVDGGYEFWRMIKFSCNHHLQTTQTNVCVCVTNFAPIDSEVFLAKSESVVHVQGVVWRCCCCCCFFVLIKSRYHLSQTRNRNSIQHNNTGNNTNKNSNKRKNNNNSNGQEFKYRITLVCTLLLTGCFLLCFFCCFVLFLFLCVEIYLCLSCIVLLNSVCCFFLSSCFVEYKCEHPRFDNCLLMVPNCSLLSCVFRAFVCVCVCMCSIFLSRWAGRSVLKTFACIHIYIQL